MQCQQWHSSKWSPSGSWPGTRAVIRLLGLTCTHRSLHERPAMCVQVRLSEALARMRLSPTVERGDVAEALRLIKVGPLGRLGCRGSRQCQKSHAALSHPPASAMASTTLLPQSTSLPWAASASQIRDSDGAPGTMAP